MSPSFEDRNNEQEVLEIVKPIYGLPDAPRERRSKFDIVLSQWNLITPQRLLLLKTAPGINVAHTLDWKGLGEPRPGSIPSNMWSSRFSCNNANHFPTGLRHPRQYNNTFR